MFEKKIDLDLEKPYRFDILKIKVLKRMPAKSKNFTDGHVVMYREKSDFLRELYTLGKL